MRRSKDKRCSRDPKELTALVVEKLEGRFGIPRRRKSLPPLDSLILTVLSQSTSDLNSDRAFESLKSAFPTWQSVMDVPVSKVEEAIRSGGLARQKSVRIQDILQWVKREFGALDLGCLRKMDAQEVIRKFTAVKGIGVKTISVTLLFSCGKDVFPVDTHVHRICRRLRLVPDKATAEKTHHVMAPLVPKGKGLSLHVNMLRLGRKICRSLKPLCEECPLSDLCAAKRDLEVD